MPVVNMEATGRNIESLMRARGLSVRDLQEILEFQTTYAVYKWIYGKSLPTVDNLFRLAVIFDVPVDSIIIVEEAYEITRFLPWDLSA